MNNENNFEGLRRRLFSIKFRNRPRKKKLRYFSLASAVFVLILNRYLLDWKSCNRHVFGGVSRVPEPLVPAKAVDQQVRGFIIAVRVMMSEKFFGTNLVIPIEYYHFVIVKIVQVAMRICGRWHANYQRTEYPVTALKSCSKYQPK